MADKGFTIEYMLSSIGARRIIPPFKCAKQFSKQDCEKTQDHCTPQTSGGKSDSKGQGNTHLGFCCATHLVRKN